MGDPLVAVSTPGAVGAGDGGDGFSFRALFPNPFSNSTQLSFELGRAGVVGVDIYDLRGRRVRAMPSRELGAGAWSISWNGRDANGAEVATGNYVYRVTLDGAPVWTRKITKLR